MPRVPTYSEQQNQLRALPNVAQESILTPKSLDLVNGRAQDQIQAGQQMMRGGSELVQVAAQMRDRRNVDMVFQAETGNKNEYLEFEKEVRERRGAKAFGATEDAKKWWDENIQKHSQALENDAQRHTFKQTAARLRVSSLESIARFESEQNRLSAVESATASKVGSINIAAVNASAWRDPIYSATKDKPEGLIDTGNIDLVRRPQVRNADGSVSTVRSMSVNLDGKEVLIPTVAADGSRILSDEEAIEQYRRTGKHLGTFKTPEQATAYAENLHRQQEQLYANGAPTDPVSAARQDIQKRNRVLAQVNGWTPERLAAEDAQDFTELHKQVIQNLIDGNASKARAYFDTYQEEINGSALDGIQKTLKAGGLKEFAQRTSDDLSSKGLSEADGLKVIRRDLKGDEQEAAAIEWKTRWAELAAAGEREQRVANDAAWKAYSVRQRLSDIPATVIGKMDGKVLEGLRDHARVVSEGRATKTDPGTLLNLYEMVRDDPDQFNRADLRQYAGKLSTADLARFAVMQNKPEKIRTAAMDQQDFDKVAEEVGMEPFAPHKTEVQKSELGNLKFAIEQRIDAEQNDKKRDLTRQEKLDIMRQEMDNKVLVAEWGRDPTLPVVLLKPGQMKDAYVMVGSQQVRLADIPAQERATIIQKRRQYGLPITEQAIAEAYLAKKQAERKAK